MQLQTTVIMKMRSSDRMRFHSAHRSIRRLPSAEIWEGWAGGRAGGGKGLRASRCGACAHRESEGVNGNGPALPGLSFGLYEFVHLPKSIGGEEYFPALSANFGGHVPQDIQVLLPAMDVLDAFLRDRSFAERAFFHGYSRPPPPIVPQLDPRPVKGDENYEIDHR